MSDRLGKKMVMRTVRRSNFVVRFKRHGRSDGHCLLTDAAVNRTVDHRLNFVEQSLLELANDLQAKISPDELVGRLVLPVLLVHSNRNDVGVVGTAKLRYIGHLV